MWGRGAGHAGKGRSPVKGRGHVEEGRATQWSGSCRVRGTDWRDSGARMGTWQGRGLMAKLRIPKWCYLAGGLLGSQHLLSSLCQPLDGPAQVLLGLPLPSPKGLEVPAHTLLPAMPRLGERCLHPVWPRRMGEPSTSCHPRYASPQ